MNSTPLHQLDPALLQQCIHCGMCLPTCPTYAETGRERSSPRGRIALMRAVAENQLPTTNRFAEEMDYCVGCLACTTACPAGVAYAPLLEAARATAEAWSESKGTMKRRFLRWLLLKQVFTRQRFLHAVARGVRLYRSAGLQNLIRNSDVLRLLPARLRDWEQQTPLVSKTFSDDLIETLETPADVRHRVLLLTGCAQDVLFADINRATADVLLANHCEVRTPRLQGCCGSLHAHNGDLATARALAQRWLDSTDVSSFDAIISNAAGCGSHLKHFSSLLANDPVYAQRAAAWDEKVRDISEWLVQINFRPPAPVPTSLAGAAPAPVRVTYHDACHLCHGQGITAQPRQLLRSIPGLQLVECEESTWCCGSAGIYSLTQPETANRLRERKWRHLNKTGAQIVALANPGCALHLSARNGDPVRPDLLHPVVLLARAYAAEANSAREKGAAIAAAPSFRGKI